MVSDEQPRDGSREAHHALERAVDMYRSGMSDLRDAATEAGMDAWSFHRIAGRGIPPLDDDGTPTRDLPAAPSLQPFVRPRSP